MRDSGWLRAPTGPGIWWMGWDLRDGTPTFTTQVEVVELGGSFYYIKPGDATHTSCVDAERRWLARLGGGRS